jgi:hypothetical protein
MREGQQTNVMILQVGQEPCIKTGTHSAATWPSTPPDPVPCVPGAAARPVCTLGPSPCAQRDRGEPCNTSWWAHHAAHLACRKQQHNHHLHHQQQQQQSAGCQAVCCDSLTTTPQAPQLSDQHTAEWGCHCCALSDVFRWPSAAH